MQSLPGKQLGFCGQKHPDRSGATSIEQGDHCLYNPTGPDTSAVRVGWVFVLSVCTQVGLANPARPFYPSSLGHFQAWLLTSIFHGRNQTSCVTFRAWLCPSQSLLPPGDLLPGGGKERVLLINPRASEVNIAPRRMLGGMPVIYHRIGQAHLRQGR